MSLVVDDMTLARGGVNILRHISCSAEKGQVLGIAGASGAGKTSLLRAMAGLERETTGRIAIDNTALAQTPASSKTPASAPCVSYVAQTPEVQLFAKTVFDEVSFGPKNVGLTREEIAARTSWALECVGFDVTRALTQDPLALSGGEKRLVALAATLALKPSYLLLDEPTSGLDASAKRQVEDCIGEVCAAVTACVVASHDMDFLYRITDHLVVLKAGSIVLQGMTADVLSSEDVLQEAGLATPGLIRLGRYLQEAGALEPGSLGQEELQAHITELAQKLLHKQGGAHDGHR